MADPAEHAGPKSLWSSPDAFPIVPDDAIDLPQIVRAIRATGAGAVKVTTWAGNERTLAFEDSETRYISCKRVWATGTTATGLEGMT